MKELIGEAAETLIRSQIAEHSEGVEKALARYDIRSAVTNWLDTIRAIEEFINLPLFAIDDEKLERAIVGMRLDQLDPEQFRYVHSELARRFGEGLADRYVMTATQLSAIGQAFQQHGFFGAAAGLQTVEHAICYLQSRRRHIVALLYTLPHTCSGCQPLERIDSLNQLLPHVEHSGMTLVGLQHQLMLAKVFPDFRLIVGTDGFTGNSHFQPLDQFFLEPERASLLEMQTQMEDSDFPVLEEADPCLVFSAAEVRNTLRIIESAYAEFDLTGTSFGLVASFLRACLSFCSDNYFVEIEAVKLYELLDQEGVPRSIRSRIVKSGGGYVNSLDEYAPFLTVGNVCYSTVTLMTRFAYYWKSVCLNRVRRFQIRAGFIFEESVKEALSIQGFSVSDVKRINRKEFDVVATLGDTIYNVQCKNNLVDLERIATDPVLFARYNRQLDRYYAKALHKEESREGLLQDKFGLSKVRHIVLSRFMVATDNHRVLPFSQIKSFRSKFAT